MRSITHVLSLLALVLLASACSGGHGTTVVLREDINGQARFHSRTLAMPGSAHFECVASASGQCHYAVFGGACGQLVAGIVGGVIECAPDSEPMARFDLAVGEQRDVEDLPLDFRHCVRERPGTITAACLHAVGDEATGRTAGVTSRPRSAG